MNTALVEQQKDKKISLIEEALLRGDLAGLDSENRMKYYINVCESLGLNAMTWPFEYVSFQNKLVLYARKDCAEQLRKINGISLKIPSKEKIGDVYIVTAFAVDKSGRTDESTGAVSIANLRGDALANAYMKAETKAKRRVTLSICGLGLLDETEIETIPGAIKFTEEDANREFENNKLLKKKAMEQEDKIEKMKQTAFSAYETEGKRDEAETIWIMENIVGKSFDQIGLAELRILSVKLERLKSGEIEWESMIDVLKEKEMEKNDRRNE